MAGTPVASPQVSSTVGLKNVVIAPLVTDTDAEHTYGDLQLLAGAIEASITPENADPTSSMRMTCALLPDNLRRNAQ